MAKRTRFKQLFLNHTNSSRCDYSRYYVEMANLKKRKYARACKEVETMFQYEIEITT